MMYRSGRAEEKGANGHSSRRALGVDTSLVLRFIATSFAYLLAGLIFLLLDLLGILGLERDAIFIMWLIGFVSMIIFGLSYMFSSGLSRSSAHMNGTVKTEYAILNIGIVAFFLGFSGALPSFMGRPLALAGLLAIIVSVSLHLMNLVLVAALRKPTSLEKQSFQDDY